MVVHWTHCGMAMIRLTRTSRCRQGESGECHHNGGLGKNTHDDLWADWTCSG